jgi:hypothetical protein
MRYPVRSVQVARETGIRTRSRMVSEALPTMWHDEALHSPVLLARVMPGLHKKLPTDAPKVGTSSRRALDVVTGFLPLRGQDFLAWDRQAALHRQPARPGNEPGKEPSQAYRQSLPHHADATYVNLGTLPNSPERSRSACDQCWARGGAFVVVRGWESQPQGEGRQLGTVLVNAN